VRFCTRAFDPRIRDHRFQIENPNRRARSDSYRSQARPLASTLKRVPADSCYLLFSLNKERRRKGDKCHVCGTRNCANILYPIYCALRVIPSVIIFSNWRIYRDVSIQYVNTSQLKFYSNAAIYPTMIFQEYIIFVNFLNIIFIFINLILFVQSLSNKVGKN